VPSVAGMMRHARHRSNNFSNLRVQQIFISPSDTLHCLALPNVR
jgi:hypothetical protein